MSRSRKHRVMIRILAVVLVVILATGSLADFRMASAAPEDEAPPQEFEESSEVLSEESSGGEPMVEVNSAGDEELSTTEGQVDGQNETSGETSSGDEAAQGKGGSFEEDEEADGGKGEETGWDYSVYLKWTQSADPDLKVTTVAKDELSATYDITIDISKGSKESYAPGEMEFRVPYTLFTDRVPEEELKSQVFKEKPYPYVSPYSIGAASSVDAGGSSSYYYTIDNKETPNDERDDEIVFRNRVTLKGGDKSTIPVTYHYLPICVKDMSSRTIQVKVADSVKGIRGNTGNQQISYTIDTGVDVEKCTAYKSANDYSQIINSTNARYFNCQDIYDQYKDQYNLVGYFIQTRSQANQRVDVIITDQPGEGGKVLKVSDGSTARNVTFNEDGSSKEVIHYSGTYYGGSGVDAIPSRYVVIGYPKQNATVTYHNHMEVPWRVTTRTKRERKIRTMSL